MNINDLEAAVYVEPSDVNRRLGELGLDESTLIRAGQRGWVAFASCTANHPPAVPGIWAWGEIICSLGEQLVPAGWRRVDEAMWPLVVNGEGTIALSAATGNENTGNRDAEPLTTCAKGPKTISAIVANRRQLVLPWVQFQPIVPIGPSGRATWILLIRRDLGRRQLRLELSRPISVGINGKINGWAERIILTPQELDGIPEMSLDDSNGPETPEITVEIKRRA
jgi:hypothetical protein